LFGGLLFNEYQKRSAMPDKALKDKVAIVTGSRRGIGRAVALAFAVSGADLVVADVVTDDGKLDEVAAGIKKLGRGCLSIKVDISRNSEVEKMVNLAVKRFGRVDILVNCAGVWMPGQTLIECPEENWDRVIDINLKGTYLCCQAAGRVMRGQNGGAIINLSSQVGLNPGTGAGAYSISKAGIIMLTRQLALELADKNIRVNALAPGIVKTDFNIDLWKNAESARQMGFMVPLGRLAEPEDIARAALFLASEESSYITGAIIPIDGGWQVGTPRRER
jgi:NAD(P)-dependent dehydrogenase (short-subunit alcohol dehydrogenase family)